MVANNEQETKKNALEWRKKPGEADVQFRAGHIVIPHTI